MLWFGGAAWRWMFIAGVVPSFAYGVLALQIPESPRYLVARGKLTEAAIVFRQMIAEDEVDRKVAEIAASMKTEHVPSLRDLRGPRFGLLGIVWVGIVLSMLQQLVGINVIFYYSTTLWHSVGMSEADALTITVVTSVTNVLVTIVAIALVDRIGRKPLLLVGSAGMAVCLAVMALCVLARRRNVAAGTARHGRARRGEWLCRVLRGVVGPGRVGAPRRDVPESDSRIGPGRRGRGAMGRELCGQRQFPGDGNHARARPVVCDLCRIRRVVVRIRMDADQRNAR